MEYGQNINVSQTPLSEFHSLPHETRTINYFYSNLLTLNNPVFCCFIFWASVLAIKMLLMSLLTALQRFRNKVFPNPEDLFFKDIEVTFNDEHVERVRRAHRNDMENILPYFTVALLYICTDPNATLACYLFRIVGVTRILHTLVYAFCAVPQPTRAIVFYIAFIITMYMACASALQMLQYI